MWPSRPFSRGARASGMLGCARDRSLAHAPFLGRRALAARRDATPAAGRRRREAAHQTKPPTALAGRGGRAAWTRLARHYHPAELWAAPRPAWWSLRGAGAGRVYAIAREGPPSIAEKKVILLLITYISFVYYANTHMENSPLSWSATTLH